MEADNRPLTAKDMRRKCYCNSGKIWKNCHGVGYEKPKQVPFVKQRHIGRNDPCWCGKMQEADPTKPVKYKKCHLTADGVNQRLFGNRKLINPVEGEDVQIMDSDEINLPDFKVINKDGSETTIPQSVVA